MSNVNLIATAEGGQQSEVTSVVEQTNTTFLDETEINVAQPHGTVPPKGDVTMTDIGEDKWSVHEMLAKPVRVANGQWSTTVTPATLIPIYSGNPTPLIIKDILQHNIESMQTNIIKSYTFLRYKVVFTFQLNSTKFYNGRLVLGYKPLATDNGNGMTVTTLTMYPSTVIDAGNAEPAQLEVPWFHPFSSFNQTVDQNGQNSLGILFLAPLTQLRAPGTAATTVDFTIYMHLEDVEFHVPINPSLTFLTPTLTQSRIRKLIEQLKAQGYELNEAHGLFDGIGSLFGKVTDTISSAGSGFGKLFEGDFSGAFDDLGGALDSGLQAVTQGAEVGMELGLFDRPYDPKYERARQPISSSYSFGCGPDSTHKLDISPFSMYKPNQNVIGRSVQKDNDLLEQWQREAVMGVRPWTTTNTVGTLLYNTQIYPNAMHENATPTWLKTFSDQFMYWKGTLIFTISVVATHFHAGRLVVVYSNGTTPETGITLDECTNWPFVTIDLHNTDNREYELETPYNQVIPFMYNVGAVNDNASAHLQDLRSAGNLMIFVQNELEAPETVATTVDIIIKVRAGPDFRCWGLRTPQNFVSQPTWSDVTLWDGVATGVNMKDQLVSTSPLTPPNVAHAGDLESVEEVEKMQIIVVDVENHVRDLEKVLMEAKVQWYARTENRKAIRGLTTNMLNNVCKLIAGLNALKVNLMDVREAFMDDEKEPNEAHAGAVEDVEEHGDSVNPVLQKGRGHAEHSLNHAAFTMTTDLRDLIRRYQFVNSIVLTPRPAQAGRVWYIPVMPGVGHLDRTMLSYFDSFYAGWSGSLRFKFVFNCTNMDGKIASVVHRPTFYCQTNQVSFGTYNGTQFERGTARGVGDGYAFYTANLIDERIISVEVPFLQPTHFLRTFWSQELNNIWNQVMNGVLELRIEDQRDYASTTTALNLSPQPVEPQNVITVDIYIAGGDDFAYHFPVPKNVVAGPAGMALYLASTPGVSVVPDARVEDETEKSYIKL